MSNIKEFALATTSPIGLTDITAGPDGNLWFPEQTLSGQPCKIGRITPTGKVNEFLLSAPDTVPGSLTVGPNGNLWFPEVKATSHGPSGQIGRTTPSGHIKEFSLLSPGNPSKLIIGPDGNLWFISGGFSTGGQIGRITPTGTITEFPLPTSNSDPGNITVGPDRNLWFTVSGDPQFAKIGRITTEGTITTFPFPSSRSSSIKIFVGSIIAGFDGNLWFTERVQISKNAFVNQIARITPTGIMSEFPLPDPNASLSELTVGPDHNLWFAEVSLNGANEWSSKIGRITPTGKISEFPSQALPTSISSDVSGYHRSIITGSDDNLWFIETQFMGTGKIGRITSKGEISEFPLPTHGNNPIGLTIGPDGKLWFTESSPDGRHAKIGHLV